jgi:hypothetical protein
MRTKALLLAAAVTAAGIASTMAQSNVYSLNVVGYVNVTLPTGYSVVNNPLDASNAGGNTVSNLFRVLNPLGCFVFTWNGSGLAGNFLDDLDGTWTDANAPLPPGKGFFFRNLTGGPLTNTFVGEVKQGAVSVPFVSGYNLVGSPVPQAAFAMDLGVNAVPGDFIYLWNGTGLSGSFYDDLDATWGPIPGVVVDPARGPTIKVGEGFFYRNISGTATFSRNFTVP